MEGLKELEPDGYLPVLVITAQPGQKLRALQAGAKDFISKPFDLPEVLMRVRNLLEVRMLHAADLENAKRLEAMEAQVENLWTTMRGENTAIRGEMTKCFKDIERALGRIEGKIDARD